MGISRLAPFVTIPIQKQMALAMGMIVGFAKIRQVILIKKIIVGRHLPTEAKSGQP
jgi:hypothetical protein